MDMPAPTYANPTSPQPNSIVNTAYECDALGASGWEDRGCNVTNTEGTCTGNIDACQIRAEEYEGHVFLGERYRGFTVSLTRESIQRLHFFTHSARIRSSDKVTVYPRHHSYVLGDITPVDTVKYSKCIVMCYPDSLDAEDGSDEDGANDDTGASETTTGADDDNQPQPQPPSQLLSCVPTCRPPNLPLTHGATLA